MMIKMKELNAIKGAIIGVWHACQVNMMEEFSGLSLIFRKRYTKTKTD